MPTSLSLILLAGLSLAAICEKIRLPRIVGMIVAGILLGPFVLDLLDPQILGIFAELRKMALIIILIRAGVSLDLSDLKKVGRPAVLMSFVPASFEILGYVLCAPLLLGVSRIEAAVMGAVLGAVSPAVVVPRMLRLMEEKRGTEKRIPISSWRARPATISLSSCCLPPSPIWRRAGMQGCSTLPASRFRFCSAL